MPVSLWEFIHRCSGCRLKWILFTGQGHPDRRCPFCDSPLVRAKEAPRG